MQEDDEGFLYPKIDTDKCINCNACEKVCPVINQASPQHPIATYSAVNPDDNSRMTSSSGGVFTAIATQIITDGGVVFGARFDNDWSVKHDFTETIEGLAAFKGSKYLQSRIGNSFQQAQMFLNAGRKVLFSGTSCQLAALRLFLRKEYDNLVAIDVVCHGVPSPMVWHKYLEYGLQQQKRETKTNCFPKLNDHIVGISFRDKRISWERYGLSIRKAKITPDRECDYFKTYDEDYYMRFFLNNLDIRPSCYNCPAKSGKSRSDMTIADYWGISEINPSIHDVRGVSLVLVHSSKGEKLLKDAGMRTYTTEYKTALKYNPAIEQSAIFPNKRDKFWKKFSKNGIEGGIDSLKPTLFERLKYSIKRRLK